MLIKYRSKTTLTLTFSLADVSKNSKPEKEEKTEVDLIGK